MVAQLDDVEPQLFWERLTQKGRGLVPKLHQLSAGQLANEARGHVGRERRVTGPGQHPLWCGRWPWDVGLPVGPQPHGRPHVRPPARRSCRHSPRDRGCAGTDRGLGGEGPRTLMRSGRRRQRRGTDQSERARARGEGRWATSTPTPTPRSTCVWLMMRTTGWSGRIDRVLLGDGGQWSRAPFGVCAQPRAVTGSNVPGPVTLAPDPGLGFG